MVDPNHSLWLSASHLPTLRLHMILTKTSTKTDKSSFSQKRLISLSPHLIFRTTPFYFVTYSPFCNLIGLQYALQKEQLGIRPDPLRASKRVWLRETSRTTGPRCLYICIIRCPYIPGTRTRVRVRVPCTRYR